MHVLMVLHNYPPEFRGGVERAVEGAVQGLLALGHKVTVLAGSERTAAEPHVVRECHGGVDVWRLVREDIFRTPMDPFDGGLVPLYEQALATIKPDVVHIHHWWNLGDDIARRAVALGFPVVLTLHDFFTSCSLFFRLPDGQTLCEKKEEAGSCGPCLFKRYGVDERELGILAAARASAFRAEAAAAGCVLAPSHSHAQLLARFLGIREPDVLGLPTDELAPGAAAGVSFPRGPLRILHFGNLSRLKGVELLAAAVELADPEGGAIELSLAGELVEQDLKLGRARHEGAFDHARLRTLAAAADVAVFPSLAAESYGMVVDEALRLGLPVIVSDRGALKERIGTRGLSVSVDSPHPLAELLQKVLAKPELLAGAYSGSPGMLETARSHAEKLATLYATVKTLPVPVVDIQTPLIERIERHRRRTAEMMALMRRLAGG